MWPNIEMDVIMAKLDALRDVLRIAYGSEGKTRESLFATAVTMVNELAKAFPDRRLLVFHRDMGRE